MPEEPQPVRKSASCRGGNRRQTEIEPHLARAFAAGFGRHQDVEQVRRATQLLALSGGARPADAQNDRWNLPRLKGRPKRMNHKSYRRLLLTAVPRHTPRMFLSPMSLALRTHPLRGGGNLFIYNAPYTV